MQIRCERCNALMRLDASATEAIARLLKSDANVLLDVGNTVLLGRCERCSHPK